jgi:hydroxyacylglutathione hydrolase
MSIEIIIIPCLIDNYAYIIHDTSSNKTTLVDAPEFYSINKWLEDKKWSLDNILITHHHDDHIGAVEKLKRCYDPLIFGAAKDRHRLPKLDVELSDRDKFSVSNLIFKCLEVSGHTIGHLAFYCASEKIIFTGDSLMALGCGRLFEGTPEQQLTSLELISSLPSTTNVYSGHEYAKQNADFALTVEPNNQVLIKRADKIYQNIDRNVHNMPTTILEEQSTNPFLRTRSAEIQRSLKLERKPTLEIFTKLREMKDKF